MFRLATWPTRTALPGDPAPAVSSAWPILKGGTFQVTAPPDSTSAAGTEAPSSAILGITTRVIARNGTGVVVGVGVKIWIELLAVWSARLVRPVASGSRAPEGGCWAGSRTW